MRNNGAERYTKMPCKAGSPKESIMKKVGEEGSTQVWTDVGTNSSNLVGSASLLLERSARGSASGETAGAGCDDALVWRSERPEDGSTAKERGVDTAGSADVAG